MKTTLKCIHCERKFKGAQGLAAHLRHNHGNPEGNRRPSETKAASGTLFQDSGRRRAGGVSERCSVGDQLRYRKLGSSAGNAPGPAQAYYFSASRRAEANPELRCWSLAARWAKRKESGEIAT